MPGLGFRASAYGSFKGILYTSVPLQEGILVLQRIQRIKRGFELRALRHYGVWGLGVWGFELRVLRLGGRGGGSGVSAPGFPLLSFGLGGSGFGFNVWT